MIDLLGVLATSPSPKPLPGVFNHFAGTLRHYGYFAVGFTLLVENMGIPLPGELVLIAAALYAANGELNIVGVGVVALIACIAGAAGGYAIGLYGGRPLADKYGKYVLITPDRLDRFERFFERRGWMVVIFGRFVDGIRQAAALIAGISDMTFRRFMTYTSIGAVLWVAVWSILGEEAGSHITTISKYAGYLAAALAVGVVLVIAHHVVRHIRRRRTGATAESSR
jgi:membrane protein DedA with SNARE-associated domain